MTGWVYPDTVERVKRACASFLKEQIDAKALQTVLYQSEQEVEAVEEQWLRSLLSDAENRLEEITYTVSGDGLKAAMFAVVQQLLNALSVCEGQSIKFKTKFPRDV
ncbi:MAG: hypothetical protein LBQ75_00900 [Zoogloeaceae bacterium]|jgi:hypothetical protein|nr:hypothetical protein [Zoogloeaceae bacterium]